MANRRKRITGENNPAAELTWPKVREIRRLADEGMPVSALAWRFNVSGQQIRNIKRGLAWKESDGSEEAETEEGRAEQLGSVQAGQARDRSVDRGDR